jgi:hypothetical protein
MSIDPLINSAIKAAPKLENISGYNLWRHSIKNYLVDRKLDDILSVEIDDWKIICEKVDSYNSKSNKVLYQMIGVKVKEPVIQPKIKLEEKKQENDIEKLNEDQVKELVKFVQRVKLVYSILYEALPSDIRSAINVDCHGNGSALWVWLEERLYGNTIDIQHEILSELFTMKQSDAETFESYKSRVDNLNFRLSQTKEDLSPTLYRFILLTKLRPEYQQVMITLDFVSEYKEAGGDNIALWRKISLAIARFERTTMNKLIDPGVEGEGSVMVARRAVSNINNNKQGNWKKGDHSKLTCHGCGKIGHIKPL